jgi:quercetin dioxygenase-like cupin family protein
MQELTSAAPVVRRAGEGDKKWFFGGGVWTWKVSGADSDGLCVVEVDMDGGKCTPLHTHPIAESLWVLEGTLRYRIGAEDTDLGAGDFVMVPSGVPHAFLVLGERARVITMQPSDECVSFYLGASEPLEGSARETDFARIVQSGEAHGGITIVGPPPF